MAGDRRELSFWDHLEELRWRLIRIIVYIAVAAAAAWFFREQLLALLRLPAETGAAMAGIEDFTFRIFEAEGGFLLMMQIALVAGSWSCGCSSSPRLSRTSASGQSS